VKKGKRNGKYKCGVCGRAFKHPMHLGKHAAAHRRTDTATQERSGPGKRQRGGTLGRRQGVGTGRRGKLAPATVQALLGAVSVKPANGRQVGGDHYQRQRIQPWDYIAQIGAGYFDGAAIKYLSGWRQKGGVDDLRKAQHYIDKLIELEAGEAAIEPPVR